MLVLITLMLITALNLSTTGFRSVGNMQFRDEAIAAANRAIEQVISSDFTAVPTAEDIAVDLDEDGDADYVVRMAQPQCLSAWIAASPPQSSVSLGPAMNLSSTWNTVWELDATVNGADNAGGAAARVHAGVRALLTSAQKNAVCP
jgi:hypothetical protein